MHGVEMQRIFSNAAWIELQASAQSVWLVMATYVDSNHVYYGGRQKLADALGKHVVSISRAIHALEKAGVIEVLRRGGAFERGEYRLAITETLVTETLVPLSKNVTTPQQNSSAIREPNEIEKNQNGSAHAQENSSNASTDIPDDDPYGLFATDSLTRSPAREPLSNEDLDDLLLMRVDGLSWGFRLCLLVSSKLATSFGRWIENVDVGAVLAAIV